MELDSIGARPPRRVKADPANSQAPGSALIDSVVHGAVARKGISGPSLSAAAAFCFGEGDAFAA